jgi:hypothetical protein
MSAGGRDRGRPFWRGGRGHLGVLVLAIAVAVVAAAVGDLVYQADSAGGSVVVTDVLGMDVTYAVGVPHYLGGPVCADCPVRSGPGDAIVVTVWLNWVCPSGGWRGANVTEISVSSPFRLVATEPGLPAEMSATSPVPTSPGNGTWVSNTTVLTLTLVAPDSAGDYSLSGIVSVD